MKKKSFELNPIIMSLCKKTKFTKNENNQPSETQINYIFNLIKKKSFHKTKTPKK